MYHILFNQSPADRQLGCFHVSKKKKRGGRREEEKKPAIIPILLTRTPMSREGKNVVTGHTESRRHKFRFPSSHPCSSTTQSRSLPARPRGRGSQVRFLTARLVDFCMPPRGTCKSFGIAPHTPGQQGHCSRLHSTDWVSCGAHFSSSPRRTSGSRGTWVTPDAPLRDAGAQGSRSCFRQCRCSSLI